MNAAMLRPSPAATLLVATAILFAHGCADDEGEPFSGDDPEVAPSDPAEIRDWASMRGYRAWEGESAIHDSAGPHFGGVRTYINPALAESLAAGNAVHPEGAAAVKELYGSDASLDGVAVMLKVGPGDTGDDWYWYERFEGDTFADGAGVGICAGCHSASPDFFRTPYPLQ